MSTFGVATTSVPPARGKYDEVLLNKTTPTKIGGILTQRRAISIQNNAANPIVVGFDENVKANTGMRIAAGGSWSVEADEALEFWGLALVADQVTGAATNWAEIGDK